MSTPTPTSAYYHRGKVREVWRYKIHHSPVDRTLQFGVSVSGKVVHRCRAMQDATEWALDRTLDFYHRHRAAEHPQVRAAEAVLQQYGRL